MQKNKYNSNLKIFSNSNSMIDLTTKKSRYFFYFFLILILFLTTEIVTKNSQAKETSSITQKIYIKDTENIDFSYDDASVKVKDGKIQCIEDDKILQWHKGIRKWQCRKPTHSVFGNLDKNNVKINKAGELECKENGKILYWNGQDNEWSCGDASDSKLIEIGNNGLNLTKNTLSINAPTCSGTDKLQWNGSGFVCSNDKDQDSQALVFDSNSKKLYISGGNDVDLSSIDTDKQTLTFNSTNNELSIFGGNAVNLPVSNLNWSLTGNSGTDETLNFLGTTDSKSLIFKTNNTEYLKLTTKGQLEFKGNGHSMFIGESAGNNDDLTDNYNTFIGYEAGKENTTGASNTVLGNNAFKSNTTSIENTLVGYDAGKSITVAPGGYSTAVGYKALENTNVTASSGINTAIGHESMKNNVTGRSNSALGASSLFYGNHVSTVALGYMAGYSSPGSSQTGGIFIGYEAGKNIQTGSYNTFIGYQSGLSNTTGANNLLVGYKAGENLTTGSGNVVIGDNIYVPNSTESNQLNIGNIIYGVNVDGTNTTISTGNIGIGIISPTAREHIKGTTADDTAYALKVDNSANNPLLYVKNDGTVSTYGARIKSYTVKTANYLITNSDTEIIDGNTTTTAFTLTLPATPTDGIIFSIKNIGTASKNLTIARNGNTINGVTSDLTLTDNQSVRIQYTSDGWKTR